MSWDHVEERSGQYEEILRVARLFGAVVDEAIHGFPYVLGDVWAHIGCGCCCEPDSGCLCCQGKCEHLVHLRMARITFFGCRGQTESVPDKVFIVEEYFSVKDFEGSNTVGVAVYHEWHRPELEFTLLNEPVSP